MQGLTRFQDALLWAATLHADQRRKASGEPYIAHLLAVTALVMEHGGNEDETIAALLHDAVEDQGGRETLEEIRRRFGPAVAEIVDGCTDTDATPKPPWRQRKEAFLTGLQTAPASIRLVTAADKLHNARSIVRQHRRQGDVVWKHFGGGRDGTLWYYRAVTEALKQFDGNPMVEELERTVAEMESMAQSSAP